MRIKRQIPTFNSSSMADIAFLLLIFFLLTSSLEKEKALLQELPEKKEQPDKPKDFLERDIFEVEITADNRLIYQDEEIEQPDLKNMAEIFIANADDNPYMPEIFLKEIPLLGKQRVTSNHLFLVRIDRESSYQTYLHVQNNIIAAYNELRNKTAMQKWGKNYLQLQPQQRDAVQQMFPYRIVETEIKKEDL